MDAVREESKEGNDQDAGRKAEWELASGSYRTDYDDEASRAAKRYARKITALLGQSAALRAQFRLLREKKNELRKYLANEDDPGIRAILTTIISGIDEATSAEKELNKAWTISG